MNFSLVEKIAHAVLYEGYMLYPYRASAIKNRQRWNFGVVYPHAYGLAQAGAEADGMQTECLVVGGPRTVLDVRVRCLHLLAREVAVPLAGDEWQMVDCDPNAPGSWMLGSQSFHVVESLEVDGRLFQTWQEAVEREVNAPSLNLSELSGRPQRFDFTFPSSQQLEPLRDSSSRIVGVIVRRQHAVEGAIEVMLAHIGDQLFKLTVSVLNVTPFENAGETSRDEALLRALVSTHTILGIRDGEFVSLFDPPAALRQAAAGCRNIGTWPVLVGEEGQRDMMLSSPIILYDYPQVAPESAGELFDATEIDELLTLRIMTLTEEEKQQMRQVDEHARRILERTETLPLEHLMKLHGAVRSLRPVKEDES